MPRFGQQGLRGLAWAPVLVGALVVLPLLSLGSTAASGGLTSARALSLGARALQETALLLSGVLILAALIGLPTAWLVARHEFPGRRIFAWALVLPFAVPTYIAAYTHVEFFDFFGPAQTAFRALTGFRRPQEYWFPEVRSYPGAVMVLGLVLYPYIYLAVRAALAQQGDNLIESARSLGARGPRLMFKVALPVIWPTLAVAATLVAFETLNDIGASQYLGVNTLTVAIYVTWLNRGDLPGAATIALAAMACAVLLIVFERQVRRNRRFQLTARPQRPLTRTALQGWRAAAAAAFCAVPVLFGFVIPVFVLAQAILDQGVAELASPGLLKALANTVAVSAVAAALILPTAVLLALAGRFVGGSATTAALRLAGLGYALPGTVLVLGLLPLLGGLDGWFNTLSLALGGGRLGLVVSGSVTAVIAALWIRFLVIGLEQAQAALGSISRNTDYAAATLGASAMGHGRRNLLPAIRAPLAGAAILIFVDCLKELPATLLLRPLNFETLATTLFGHASRGNFEEGALAGLLIVAAGLLPMLLANRLIDGGRPAFTTSGRQRNPLPSSAAPHRA